MPRNEIINYLQGTSENLTPPEPVEQTIPSIPTDDDVPSPMSPEDENEFLSAFDDDRDYEEEHRSELGDNEVYLYTDEIVEYTDDLVPLPGHTFARPTDPYLTVDFITNDNILKFNACKVFDKYPFDLENPKFTLQRDYLDDAGYPLIKIDGSVYSFTPNILNDFGFNKLYAEDYNKGIFKLKTEITPFKKKMRIEGLKYKAPKTIEDKSKAITYRNTLGKQYSFGLEIETISGFVPTHVLAPLNCSSVHDGSLRDREDNHAYGKEYVTDVLTGDIGLLKLKKLCSELTKRCLVNYQCGVHVHLSNINFTKENVILMYYLYTTLQREIFLMLPKSRRGNEYCRFLNGSVLNNFNVADLQNLNREFTINHYYNNIVKYISNHSNGKKVNKKYDHPKGFKCGYDHESARYCWVNFVPALFNTRKNNVYTIEFRPAPGSTSYIKIKNWLLICMALVDVVENHKRFIYDTPQRSLSLNDVLYEVYGKNADKLVAWVDKRKFKFSADEFDENTEYDDNELDNNISLKNL